MPRYAVYWAPEPDDPLWAAGCAWLGRDPTSAAVGAPLVGRHDPWRYGFHATLKAPMALAVGCSAADLQAALGRLAGAHAAFVLPPLAVGTMAGFVALRLSAPCPALQALADDCVVQLDRFRRPLSADERHRRSAGLDHEQQALLDRWGYPHVLHRWRFHLTLTDGLPPGPVRDDWVARAHGHFAPALAQPRAVQSVSVFEEPAPGQPFAWVARVPLGPRAD